MILRELREVQRILVTIVEMSVFFAESGPASLPTIWLHDLRQKGQNAMSQLRKIDHVSYACAAGQIEKWAWFHIEVEGGTLIKRIDDARPGDPHSSMKIWCIDYGNFGVALIEGIDRAGKSQVTSFVEKHGDHSC